MYKSIKKRWRFCLISVCLTITSAPWILAAAAQGSNAPSGNNSRSVAAKAKEVKFEVLSIRPVKQGFSPYDGGVSHLGDLNPTPTGFISTLTVWQMLMIAYAPTDQAWDSIPMVNAPKWFSNIPPDWFSINARVPEPDIAAWRNQTVHHELLRFAMRDLLKRRCKLMIHEQPAELQDYKLVIGKKGLKMKTTPPGSALPRGVSLASGGVMVSETRGGRQSWHFHGATIGDIVEFLGRSSKLRPVHDGTGLPGRYDFTLQMAETPSNDHADQTGNWPVASLGLELKPGKFPGSKLVIDHIEKPSAND